MTPLSAGEAGWMTIDTCPESDEVVAFHIPGRRWPCICRSDDWHYKRKPDGTGYAYWLDGATHWMRFPPPPEPLERGE